MKKQCTNNKTYTVVEFFIFPDDISWSFCNLVPDMAEISERLGAADGEKLEIIPNKEEGDPRTFTLFFRENPLLRTKALLVKTVPGDNGEIFDDITNDDSDDIGFIKDTISGMDTEEISLNISITPFCKKETIAALEIVARALELGEDFVKDEKRAFRLYWICANKGNPMAAYRVGRMIYEHREPDDFKPMPYSISHNFFVQAAEAGITRAMIYLGMDAVKDHENGMSDFEGDMISYNWIKMAAEKGDGVGLYYLGRCYHLGIGTPKDDKKAFEILKPIADDDKAEAMKDACREVGQFYRGGICTDKDYKTAIEYFKKGIKAGNALCLIELAYMYRKGLGVDKDTDKAKRLYLYCIKVGETGAYYSLAEMYEKDVDSKYHLYCAREYYLKALDRKDWRAEDALTRISMMLARENDISDEPFSEINSECDEPGFINIKDSDDEEIPGSITGKDTKADKDDGR